MEIGLIATIHDPKGKNISMVKEFAEKISKIYNQVFLVVSDKTNIAYIEELKKYNFNVKIIPKKGAADARRQVLKFGLSDDKCDFFHYCDFDRILIWEKNYFDELEKIVNDIVKCDYLIIGRTERAFLTHPLEWVETEKISNKVFSLEFGKNVDITAGSCAFSRGSAEKIDKHSSDDMTDAEWPMIIHRLTSYKIDYIAVEGLEYIHKVNGNNIGEDEGKSWLSRIKLCYIISNSSVNKCK